MSVKAMIRLFIEWFFRLVIKPVISLFPDRRREQLMTIAHHINLTLFHGYVMQFENPGISVKVMIRSFIEWFFRLIVKPLISLLPERRRNQLMTIAHHINLALFHGHVMQFDNSGVKLPDPAGFVPAYAENALVSREIAEKEVAQLIESEISSAVPSWVVNEFYELAEIQSDLYPTPEFLAQYHIYRQRMNDAPGRVYAICRKIIGDTDPDIIFLAPWMKRGGADLGVLHHIDAAIKRGFRAVLITTLDAESPWLERVPKDVPVVELGRLGRGLTEEEGLLVLIRLVLQTNASTIHIINSQLGWEMLKTYAKPLRATGKSVFASLYSDEITTTGQRYGYSRYVPSTLPYLSGIICDTRCFPEYLSRRYGVDNSRMHAVYFPSLIATEPKYISSDKGSILWASRLTWSKRPDILYKIALAMPGFHFHVKGYGELHEEKQMEQKLAQLPNITFTGPYEKLVDDGNSYCLFLYTSIWDGMPNILLEATMAGLPIVASSVGGVPELINEETGYPVEEIESVDAYVSTIRRALANPEERYQRWRKALELLEERHSSENFLKCMDAIDEYFCARSDQEIKIE